MTTSSSSSAPTQAFSRAFPPELLLHILTLAALADPKTAHALLTTSRLAHVAAQPIVRHVARLSSARKLSLFATPSALDSADEPRFGVRHLGVLCQASPARVRAALAGCTQARSVACGFSFRRPHCVVPSSASRAPSPPALEEDAAIVDADSDDAPLVHAPEYHLLGLACRDGWDASLLPRSLTRLHVQLTQAADFDLHESLPTTPQDEIAASMFEDGPALASLPTHAPNLTHLALTYRASLAPPERVRAACTALLRRMPSLSVLLLQPTGAPSSSSAFEFVPAPTSGETPSVDARVVVVPRPAMFSPAKQWEDAARASALVDDARWASGAEQGIWHEAAGIVESRRRQVAAAVAASA